MILVIGGAFQGKSDFVREKYNIDPVECTCETADFVRAINSYEKIVRQILKEGKDPVEYTKDLIEKNPDAVVICTEIGMGIVPMDKEERLWREQTGKCLKLLAAASEEVYRVYAGVGVKIK